MPDGQQYEVVDAKLARTAKAFAAYERATPGGSGSWPGTTRTTRVAVLFAAD
jgi:hypothetical protein